MARRHLHPASKRNLVDARDNYNMALGALQPWEGETAAQLLLEHGASVHVWDNSNQTPAELSYEKLGVEGKSACTRGQLGNGATSEGSDFTIVVSREISQKVIDHGIT